MIQTSPAARKTEPATGPLWWIWQVLTWMLLVVTLVVLGAVVVVPRIAGATPYTILTGSMTPAYSPGTLVVVKKVPANELAVGAPITYQLESGEATVVTHRIIAVSRNARGEVRFVTKGDANGSADPEPVRPEQIRGEVWYSIPYLGRLNSAITGQHRSLVLMVVITGLVVYAGWMFISGHRETQRDRRSA